MNKLCTSIGILLALSTMPVNAMASEAGDLKNFTGLIVVVTNDFKEKDRRCGVNETRISSALRKVTYGKPFVLSSDLTEVGNRAGFLAIRFEGFGLGEMCVIHLLFQVKAGVDIVHNRIRAEAALSSRSTTGLIKRNEVESEILKVVTVWGEELAQDWVRDNQ